ncbi:MAG: hypothetical protein EOO01_26050 [Chitinophagaceae bacterium]|nr:MAG: hypothetical protein EOO01_26050 [Chitinophagaceae bacterium]
MQHEFRITRVYSDENGDSKFQDIFLPLMDSGEIGFLSETVPARGIIFREVKPDYNYDYHNAPRKQYLVLVDGGIEIETSTGERRIFNTGEVLLLEDISGKGHRTRNLENRARKSIFITLD